jgi:hypothetical protein
VTRLGLLPRGTTANYPVDTQTPGYQTPQGYVPEFDALTIELLLSR